MQIRTLLEGIIHGFCVTLAALEATAQRFHTRAPAVQRRAGLLCLWLDTHLRVVGILKFRMSEAHSSQTVVGLCSHVLVLTA